MRLALAGTLFLANVYAIVVVLGSRARIGARIGRALGIMLLPVLGLLLGLGWARRQRMEPAGGP
jgi:hypothetical protein